MVIRDKLIFSSKKMIRKNYKARVQSQKELCGRDSQGAWRLDDMIGRKLPVVE
jgi:hypothetical protein